MEDISIVLDSYRQSKMVNDTRPIYKFLDAHDLVKIEAIKECMLSQVKYAWKSQGHMIPYQTGYNHKTGQHTDANTLMDMTLAPATKLLVTKYGLDNKRLSYHIDKSLIDVGY